MWDLPRIWELISWWSTWDGDEDTPRFTSVGPYIAAIEIDFDGEDVEKLNGIVRDNPDLFSGFVQECIDGSLLCEEVLSIPGCKGNVNRLLEGYRWPIAPYAAIPSATG